MRKPLVVTCLLALAAVLVAPVVAETFVVTLTSGSTFETRYQPSVSADG